MRALVSDPGGVPPARHSAAGTAAFRSLENVGFLGQPDVPAA